MIYILDYDPGLGGLAAGLEDGENFIVSNNLVLNDSNKSGYLSNFLLRDEMGAFDHKIDMFVASPRFGDKIGRRGSSNFDLSETQKCFSIIDEVNPKYILIGVCQPEITYLQNGETVVYTYDKVPSTDIIIAKLVQMGYTVQNFTIDSVTYRSPQQKIRGFYFAVKNDLWEGPIVLPEVDYDDKKKESILDWLDYCKKYKSKLNEPDFKKEEICSLIKPGMKASKTKEVSVKKGYWRLKDGDYCMDLGSEFYKVSSDLPSIHPIENRPLTVLEGAVLAGVPVHVLQSIDNKVSKKEIGQMINRYISPIFISDKIRMGLIDLIGD